MALDDRSPEYWRRLADEGDTVAMRQLAYLLRETDPASSQIWLRRAVQAGDVAAVFSLGVSLSESKPAEAAQWYRRAAEAGDRSAMFNLGLLAKVVHRRERRRWLERAAGLGHPEAAHALGVSLLPWHPRRAQRWFRRGADDGNQRSMVRVASDLDIRRRTTLRRARRERLRLEMLWLLMGAAELGDADAMWRLGLYCGSHDDDEGASRWYQSAAERGHSAAQLVVNEGRSPRSAWRVARATYREATR